MSTLSNKNDQTESGTTTPSSSARTSSSSGHKGSLRSTKLARRARSFKDDLFEKISQIRTPTNTMNRSYSPSNNSPSSRSGGVATTNKIHSCEEPSKPAQDLNYHVQQVKHALIHFKNVVGKNKLEMLSDNGTVVLDMICNVHNALQSYTLNENSSVLISATTQVYMSLGKLIKFCDEILLSDDEETGAKLSQENVKDIVELVESSVNNLVKVANEKILEKETCDTKETKSSYNTLQRPSIDIAGQRTSLPDIPLTPRERDILEKSSIVPVRTSHSTESILRDVSPPPKPPLPPHRDSRDSGGVLDYPPPLPPKRRSQNYNNRHFSFVQSGGESDFLSDDISIGCKSNLGEEDNSSLLSASAGSLDSALNHSREEDELKALAIDHSSIDEQILASDLDLHRVENLNHGGLVESSSGKWGDEIGDMVKIMPASGVDQLDRANNRHSNESGFVSMQSIRASIQTVSSTKRISSQKTSIISTTGGVVGGKQTTESSSEFHQADHHQQSTQILQQSSTISPVKSPNMFSMQGLLKHSYAEQQETLQRTINVGKITSSVTDGFLNCLAEDEDFDDCIFEDTPPALPVKTRKRESIKERHLSTYDNVEDLEATEKNALDLHLPLRNLPFAPNFFVSRHDMGNKHQSLIEPRHLQKTFSDGEEPPPLPMKKKHIMAYMEIFGNCSQTHNTSEFLRHSLHTYNVTHAGEKSQHHMSQSHSNMLSQTVSISSLKSSTNNGMSPLHSPKLLDKPPALPPKRLKGGSRTSTSSISNLTPPSSPKIMLDSTSVSSTNESTSSPISNQILSDNNLNAAVVASSTSPSSKKISNLSRNHHQHFQQHQKIIRDQFLSESKENYLNLCDTTTGTRDDLIKTPTNSQEGIGKSSTEMTTTTSTTTTTTPITTALTTPKQNQSVMENNELELNETSQNVNSCSSNSSKLIGLNNHVTNNHNETNIVGNLTTTQNLDTTTTTTNTPNHGGSCNNNHNNNLNSSSNNNCLDENDELMEDEVVLRRHGGFISESPSTTSSNVNSASLSSTSTNRDKSPISSGASSTKSGVNIMEEIDISKYLVVKKEGEEGPNVKGGHPDALIIHATRRSDNEFGEAFITTFRTFISPQDLIEKLITRYTLFIVQMNDQKQRAAKESFSLLARVICDLTSPDLSIGFLEYLMDFVYQLVCSGHLKMAKLLRVQILKKAEAYKLLKLQQSNCSLSSRAVITLSPPSLLDLKPSDIAEQMTLLDAELFEKIEIPEVLIWAQEQCEERSPNLTRFTEHFNKMSYWARSQILKQEDAKDREKHVVKFIKIMKHLRKINNYNSYLALLSALDSAPIRRLDWHNQKQINEGLKEYCALIDSSSSFRAYRQALAETSPPCIPYIGLVLQDLTFVHIGNPNMLNDNNINFSKRYQQYNIVVNMKKFKKCTYPFKRNEKIIGFFDNFENYLDEDAMWQISENIKPRGGRRQPAN